MTSTKISSSGMTTIAYLIGILFPFANCNEKKQNQVEYISSAIEDSSYCAKMKSSGMVILLPDSIEYVKEYILIRDKNGGCCPPTFFLMKKRRL